MPRDLVLGNGSMLVNFDRGLNMRDLYYPKVGLNNHVLGHRNRLGVWVDGRFSWSDEDSWNRTLGYKKRTMVSQVSAVNEELGVSLEISDAVHYKRSFYLKKVAITNASRSKTEFRLFFSHDLSINESELANSAFYDPTVKCICHYKRDKYFLINGRIQEDGIYQYAIGTKRFEGAEGTWRDAEDGYLEQNSVAHGSIDSTVSFRITLDIGDSATLYYWIAVGDNLRQVRKINSGILEKGPQRIFEEIAGYWETWSQKKQRSFADLSSDVEDMYYRSLLVIRTQTDNGGAILAATDSDVLMFYPDHYNYVWPRDGALVSYALDFAGYPEITAKFYEFCKDIISEGGFFLHKYNSDGTLGSSWHPWWRDGKMQLPIQEDETALVLFALGNHYDIYRDIEFIDDLYKPLVVKAADFLVSYRDPATKLPLPSFDLWEERRGVFSFTCSAVYGALTAAAKLAFLLKDRNAFNKYGNAALEVRTAMEEFLYCPELGRFARGIYPKPDGTFERDCTLDSSLYGLFEFGSFSPSDKRIVSTMNAVKDGLWVKTEIGGAARYVNDCYSRVSEDIERVPGNPWVICTLWLAEWYADTAVSLDGLARSRELIEWAVRFATPGGVLPEQVHPYNGGDISVSPLTWSHSTFILATDKYLAKYLELSGQCRPN